MEREELIQKLLAYTENEKQFLKDGNFHVEVPQPQELLEEEILQPGENIGIVRQDRFRPVGKHRHLSLIHI